MSGQLTRTTTNPRAHWTSCKPSEHVRHRGGDRRAQWGSNPCAEEGNKSLPPLGHNLMCDFHHTFKFIYGDHSLPYTLHLLLFLLFIHFFSYWVSITHQGLFFFFFYNPIFIRGFTSYVGSFSLYFFWNDTITYILYLNSFFLYFLNH